MDGETTMASEIKKLIDLIEAIAVALDCPRNRFGKLDPDASHYNAIHPFVEKYQLPHGGRDLADQVMMLCRAASKESTFAYVKGSKR